MTTFKRKNAYNNGGSFSNPDLLWYAKGVGVMQSRKLSDSTSWWFYAAIHGQYITNGDDPGTPAPSGYPNWADIPAPPKVPTTPLPSQSMMNLYWDQCQHAGWFFPPWHRGYLYAIENILREIIISLGGPKDWALPYWNYFGKGESSIPTAFTQLTLPDGSPNPLYVNARYGPAPVPKPPYSIYVQIPPASQQCQNSTAYTNSYGGGVTGFDHFDSATGTLEQNPHNLVHGMVGGQVSGSLWGLMSDPGLAALDPIFYLHHCNIDRMWAAWNAAGKTNPTDPKWLNGPTASGDRKFCMPKPDGSEWQYTPGMVNSISQLNYTYDDIAQPALLDVNSMRLRNLALIQDAKPEKPMDDSKSQTELVGANNAPIKLGASGASTTVKLDNSGWKTVTNSLLKASAKSLPDEVYLQLEGVKGTADANMYTVSVNHQYVGHIALFGIRIASMKNSKHGGAGLTIRLNISEIIDKLHLSNAIESNSLDVLIQPSGPVFEGGECTIDKVSIYRKSQQ